MKKYTLNLTEQQRIARIESLKASNQRVHQAANEAYDAHPNLCKKCGNPIPRRAGVRLSTIKKKEYCNHSCAAKFNNQISQAPKRIRKIKPCKSCGNPILKPNNKLCHTCLSLYNMRLSSKTKAEIYKKDIASHARNKMNGTLKVCLHCGWNKFVEVCHIRAIKNFPPTATVEEINARDNLMYLCPNCHWEFDHGLL